jgi:centromere-localized protein 2
MAPSEESILANYLLLPSPLPTVISLEKFTELFPKRMRSHPQIRTLYREMQHVRAQDIGLVRENIDREVKRGERQKEDLKNARLRSGVTGMDREDNMEADLDIQLFGQPSNSTPSDMHSLESLLPEMERSCASIERQIKAMEAETAEVLANISTTVGALSDLRYGKFNKPAGVGDSFADETIRGLNRLEEACQHVVRNE